jgi:hypothetical protein
VSALVRLGFRRRSAKDLVRDLSRSRWRLSLTLVASMVAPLAEIGFILLLYALVEPAQKAALMERLAVVRVESFPGGDFTGSGYRRDRGLSAAVVLLCVTIGRRQFTVSAGRYLFESFIIQSRRIMAAYLSATPARAMMLTDRTCKRRGD